MWILKGLFREAEKGGAGEGAGGTGAGAAEGAGSSQNGGAPPPAFDWKSFNLDPATQNVVEAHGWKDIPSMVNSYSNLQKVLGIKSGSPDRVLVLPKDGDPPEAWNEVFTKLGRPAKAEEYGLPVPEGQPRDFANKASEWFHELGIPKGAAVKLAERFNAYGLEMSTAQQAQITEAHNKQMTDLKTEWGANYESNSLLVDKAAQTFGMGKEELSALKQAMGPGAAMKFLHNIGSKLGAEGRFVDGEGGNSDPVMSPAQAEAEIQRLKKDQSFIQQWNSTSDPKARQDARALMSKLQQMARPGATEIRAAK